MAEIIAAGHPEAVARAVRLLRAGELVCYPTDTVYGIGAAASNEAAVRRLYAVKGRRADNPVPLLLADSRSAPLVAEVTPVARALMSRFWPGGLTIVMRKRPEYQSAALGGTDTVGLRVPDCDVVRDIIRALGEPITGTSANRSGGRAPVSAQEAASEVGEMVALVIDGGPSTRLRASGRGAVESTVVDVSSGAPRVLREGAVRREELSAALGQVVMSGE